MKAGFEMEDIRCYNIDDFSQVAKENNDKKLKEAKMARGDTGGL